MKRIFPNQTIVAPRNRAQHQPAQPLRRMHLRALPREEPRLNPRGRAPAVRLPLRHRELLHHPLARHLGVRRDHLEDLEAPRVGEGLGDARELLVVDHAAESSVRHAIDQSSNV